jgi:hypothetical protein
MNAPKKNQDIENIFLRYWSTYGGLKALFASGYLHVAILLTLIAFSHWTKPRWWDLPLTILPNLLGFSLAGYAVWLSFGDEGFRKSLSIKNKDDSLYMKVNATFAHFIIIQIGSLLYAFLANSLPLFHVFYLFNGSTDPSHMKIWNSQGIHYLINTFWFLGDLLFIYSILCGLAATMGVFRFSSWLDTHWRSEKTSSESACSPTNRFSRKLLKKYKTRVSVAILKKILS